MEEKADCMSILTPQELYLVNFGKIFFFCSGYQWVEKGYWLGFGWAFFLMVVFEGGFISFILHLYPHWFFCHCNKSVFYQLDLVLWHIRLISSVFLDLLHINFPLTFNLRYFLPFSWFWDNTILVIIFTFFFRFVN